jgi:hypothetical protein
LHILVRDQARGGGEVRPYLRSVQAGACAWQNAHVRLLGGQMLQGKSWSGVTTVYWSFFIIFITYLILSKFFWFGWLFSIRFLVLIAAS